MKLIEQIAAAEEGVKLLKAFQEKFGASIPEGLGYYSIGCFKTGGSYSVSLSHRTDPEREKALAAIGEIFGTHGWVSTYAAYSNSFTWNRTIDGVEIAIDGAKVVPPPVQSAVHPSEFPILLKDSE